MTLQPLKQKLLDLRTWHRRTTKAPEKDVSEEEATNGMDSGD